ncbi:TonB-dependent receptor [Allomuricauda sp. SCSIO 65647]|uniref:TonB-dependent receptor n=1 Tax=Allomuricauda sp. SCSIO 65647 TaxID=2908843 RepID=UPI001F3E39D5|nr:TonB-dependent receptor [Muricauda sp. SCSIO 65647]UJH66201.1 TonB-dependent receptor [Muricauda sp. SCSIO 65647]
MKNFIVLAVFLFCTSAVLSQRNGTIVGKLTDKELNNEPLAFANVLIKGTTTGTTSDFDGLYEIDGVEPGTYTIVYSYLGYETVEVPDVVVEPGKVTEVNVPMSASQGVALDEVVVTTTTRRNSEISLLLQQKKALVIQEAISAEALTRKGIDNAAAAVAQISGVSKQQGSDNVYVRGLGDRYQSTTLNGLTVPSNDVNKKNIDLDIFSSDIIENVSVSKAFTPSAYGDFAAGNVDINSTQYFGDGFIAVSTGAAVNTRAIGESSFFPIHDGSTFLGHWKRFPTSQYSQVIQHGVDPDEGGFPVNGSLSVSGGASFNFSDDSRFSFFANLSHSNSYEFLQGLSGNYSATADILFPNVDRYIFSTNTTGILNLVFRANDNNKFRFNSIVINDSRSDVGYFGTEGKGLEIDLADDGYYQLNSQFDQNVILVNQLLGDHKISDKVDFFWGTAYNRVFADQPDRRRITLDIGDFTDPEQTNFVPDVRFITNNNFDSQRFYQEIDDEEFTTNLAFSIDTGNESKLRIGYSGRSKTRDFESIRYGYGTNINDNLDQYGPIDIDNFNDVFNIENFALALDNNPDNDVFNLFVLRPAYTEDSPIFPIGDARDNLPGLPENVYSGELETHAGFADYQWKISEKWSAIPGLRVENYNQSVLYDVINVEPGEVNFTQTELLPSLNVKYSPNDKNNYRLAFSRTISIPEFKEVAPFVYEDVTQQIGGNPDLLNTLSEIYNLDLKWEVFPSQGELISAAVFGKVISDPVNLVIANDAANTRRFFRTGDRAEVFGAEVEISKVLAKYGDTGELKIGANASYLYTNQDLKDVDGTFTASFPDRDSDALQGASPFIANGDITYRGDYENYKTSLTLSGSYFYDRIFAIGSSGRGNQIEKAVPTLNLAWLNSIGDHFQINLKASNILDPNIRIVQENTNDGTVDIETFRRGISIGLSLKYTY